MEPFATTTSDDTSTIQLLKDVGWQIVEGPGEVGFSKATYAVFEDKSTVRVTVNRVMVAKALCPLTFPLLMALP